MWVPQEGSDPDDDDTQYWRAGLWTEDDGTHPWNGWDTLPDTYWYSSDTPDSDIGKSHLLRISPRADLLNVRCLDEDGQRGKDHPKLYFNKWTHSVWPWSNTDASPHICLSSYSSNDYRYEAGKWLVTWDALPTDWDFGTANSVPSSFGLGGRYDMCLL